MNISPTQPGHFKTLIEHCVHIRDKILRDYDPDVLGRVLEDENSLEELSKRETDAFIQNNSILLNSSQQQQLATLVRHELAGYGPIQEYLDDPDVEEVMVNGPDQVYIARYGEIEETECKFYDNEHVKRIIDRIIRPLNRQINEASPMVDGRLPDGSRVNAIIPPLALNGPTLTIRKFAVHPLTVDDLINFGTLTPQMAEFLRACVYARINILISGGTGSGKTTTLNVLSGFIPENERIITIEDAAELKLQQPHWVRLESRPPNIEGFGEVTVRQLVRNSLRMRPTRIIVGEVRGGEALDMLQAMNTGHDGSVTTLHANNPREALLRLETLVLLAGTELPSIAIKEQICAAIDLIVHQSLMRDGSRKIDHITEIQRMEGEQIITQDIFVFDHTYTAKDGSVIGMHRPTGFRPKFLDRLKAHGIELSRSLFETEEEY